MIEEKSLLPADSGTESAAFSEGIMLEVGVSA